MELEMGRVPNASVHLLLTEPSLSRRARGERQGRRDPGRSRRFALRLQHPRAIPQPSITLFELEAGLP